VRAGTREYRAVFAALGAMEAVPLPGAADHETGFSPGRAHVRRVTGHPILLAVRSGMTVPGRPSLLTTPPSNRDAPVPAPAFELPGVERSGRLRAEGDPIDVSHHPASFA
jgi:hypothetical protein